MRPSAVGILAFVVMSAFLFSAGVAVGRVHVAQPTKTVLFLCGFAAVVIVNGILWAAFTFLRRSARAAQERNRAGGRSA